MPCSVRLTSSGRSPASRTRSSSPTAELRRLVLLGIPTRGVALARRIADASRRSNRARPLLVGALDVTMYRDDLARTRPVPRAYRMPAGGIDGKTVVLVDDVLYSGRTIRAALDAIADLGRPRAVRLAVLVDRGHRELPIRADYVGKNLPTSAASDQRATARDRRRRRGHDRGRRHEAPSLTRDLEPRTPSRILDIAEDMAAAGARSRNCRRCAARPSSTCSSGLHTHPDLVRGRGQATACRRHQLPAKGSSVSKGETLKDTAQTLQAMGADAVVIRHPASGAPAHARHSGWIDAGVINAATAPTSTRRRRCSTRSRSAGTCTARARGTRSTGCGAIVGDILHSRVARSNVWLLTGSAPR